MTHRHIETITFGACLVICAYTHKHRHTQTHRHSDIGTGTVGLPSLQAYVGVGASLLLSHFFQGGLENYLAGGGGGGGVAIRGLGGCSFLCFTGGSLLDFYGI